MVIASSVQSLPSCNTWVSTQQNILVEGKTDREVHDSCEDSEKEIEDKVLVELVKAMRGRKCTLPKSIQSGPSRVSHVVQGHGSLVVCSQSIEVDEVEIRDDQKELFEAIAAVNGTDSTGKLYTCYLQLTNKSEGTSQCTPDPSE